MLCDEILVKALIGEELHKNLDATLPNLRPDVAVGVEDGLGFG